MADLDFIQLSINDILQIFKTAYFDQYGETLRIGSEEFAAASIFSYAMSVLFAAMNDSAKQRFIDTATGEYLDAIAATYGITERPKGYKATCLVDLRVMDTYPAYAEGAVRITDASGEKVFENARAFSGDDHHNLPFRAVEAGSSYNGIPEAKLTEFSGEHTGILTATNTTMTNGGTDAMTDDEDFRVWLKNEIASYAGAGTALAYRGKAMNVDSRILDVLVVEQGMKGYEKGKAKLYVLCDETVAVPEEVTQLVYDAVSDRAFRPIGDLCEVKPAKEKSIDIPGVFYILYPQRFESVAYTRTQRISDEYEAYVKSAINRPFVYAEFVKRILDTDENGVYATECVVMGLADEPKPIYPSEIDPDDPDSIGTIIKNWNTWVQVEFDKTNG